ncbi:MAG TPA: hypothetical protein VJI15_02910 [Candidatus Nanoarchaeia archaeon]|nr:hypothetical protein [Candidatus Nanoarchaeia archaeon]
MVNVPAINFFSAEGGLLFEAHKLRSLDARFKAAKRALGKYTVTELLALESARFAGKNDMELKAYFGGFKTNFYDLLNAYTQVVKEINRIFGLVSQKEYEDLLSLKETLDLVTTASTRHPDWFVYNSDDLHDFRADFIAVVKDLQKKLVEEYSLTQTVGAHGKSTLLRLRAFLKSRGIIERYAEAKAMRIGRVYRKAKKKEAQIQEKIKSGENFLPVLKEYVHLLDDLNQLLHVVALDILTVFQRFESELDALMPIYREFINNIHDATVQEEILVKYREFVALFIALRRQLENPQWANISNTLGKNILDEADELMKILLSRSREGPRTRGVRVKKENKEQKKREKAEARRIKRENKEQIRQARKEAMRKRKEALANDLKKRWWRVKHVTSSTAEGLKEGWIEGGRKQEAKREERARARKEARERQEELRKGVRPTPGPKMNLLRHNEVQERIAKQRDKQLQTEERRRKIDVLKKKLAGKWWRVKHVTSSTAEGLKEGWIEGGRKQNQKREEKAKAREEAKRLKEKEKEWKQETAEQKKKEKDQAKAKARDQAKLAAAERWRLRKERLARLFRRSLRGSGSTPSETSAEEQTLEKTEVVRKRLFPRRKPKP